MIKHCVLDLPDAGDKFLNNGESPNDWDIRINCWCIGMVVLDDGCAPNVVLKKNNLVNQQIIFTKYIHSVLVQLYKISSI